MGEALSDMIDYLGSSEAWQGRNGLPALLWAHVQLAFAAVVVGALVAVPPAVMFGHVRRGALLAVSVVNIGRAIPTYAVIALVFPLSLQWGFGLGFWPTMVALVLLAIPPIFTNTYTGVRDVPAEAIEAGQGMGMRTRQLVARVELPVALPLILTGVRVSAVQVVGTATLGTLVGYRCLGNPIIVGFRSGDRGPLLAAAIVVTLLALATDAVFTVAERLLVRWRRRPGRTSDVTIAAETATTEPVPAPADTA